MRAGPCGPRRRGRRARGSPSTRSTRPAAPPTGRGPDVDAGVFGDGVQPLAAATYCELDVTGTQLTRPPPLNELPDPLLQRLVDADLVDAEERQVQRIEADPKTGEFVRYNITTTDPRVLSNAPPWGTKRMAPSSGTPAASAASRSTAPRKRASSTQRR
ncbi:hypothetical protein JL720_2227 [Aureococcus anophagefferens]|nr:hypothetical protein JL720_2227 [Aureococcus anophagefferens]